MSTYFQTGSRKSIVEWKVRVPCDKSQMPVITSMVKGLQFSPSTTTFSYRRLISKDVAQDHGPWSWLIIAWKSTQREKKKGTETKKRREARGEGIACRRSIRLATKGLVSWARGACHVQEVRAAIPRGNDIRTLQNFSFLRLARRLSVHRSFVDSLVNAADLSLSLFLLRGNQPDLPLS